MTALAEVACITGTNELQQTAALLGTWSPRTNFGASQTRDPLVSGVQKRPKMPAHVIGFVITEKRVLFPEARAKMDWRALCLSLTANKNVYDFPPEVRTSLPSPAVATPQQHTRTLRYLVFPLTP